MQTYRIDPRDVLFFRDARPMSGSSEGAGSSWPLPSVLHSALMSAFHQQWPERPGWESEHRNRTDREKIKQNHGHKSSMRFGGLNTVGPFPATHSDVFVPTPADLTPSGMMQPVNSIGANNLPKPLKYAVASTAPPSKKELAPWISISELRKYLRGEADVDTTAEADLYLSESRPGVGIDPETHSNLEGIFYQAEYLRLRENVHFVFKAEAEAKQYNTASGCDLLTELLTKNDSRQPLVFGGQRGVAYAAPEQRPLFDELPTPENGQRVKWVLLTPALFGLPPRKDGAERLPGWRPDWVDDQGQVRLRDMPNRAEFANRKEWRDAAQSAPPIAAELVAARIPKPIPVSGWKLDIDADHAGGAAKPTRLLVPAGAVFYFQCENADSAKALIRQLHCKVKAPYLGEKGFGYGVCGTWDFMEV